MRRFTTDAARQRPASAVILSIGAASLVGALFAAAPAAVAQTIAAAPPPTGGLSPEAAQALAARLDELQAEVAELRAKLAANEAADHQAAAGKLAAAPPAPAQPTVAFSGPRPTFASADGQFSTTVHAVMQLDTAAYDQAPAGPVATDLRRSGPALGASAANVDSVRARDLKDGTVFRRARVGVDGTAFGDWEYRITIDFGGQGVENAGQLFETWVQYDGFKPARIRVGEFAPSVGLDDQSSVNATPFLERALAADIARSVAGGDSRIAAQVFAAGDGWLAAAAVTGRTVASLNTGTAAATAQSYADQLGYTGRIAVAPIRNADWLVHLGANGSYVARPANAGGPGATGAVTPAGETVTLTMTPELRVDATKLVNTGAIPARHAETLGAEFAVQRDNLLLEAEYQHIGVQRSDGLADPHFAGYYVSGTWVLTGERRAYNGATAAFDAVPVAHPFNPRHGGWGAWELAARYSDMQLNFQPGAPGTLQTGAAIRGGEETNLTAGVNWYPNSLARFMLEYQHVTIDRLSPAATASAASTVWLAPAGAQIGQSYDVWAVRSQFAF